MEINFLHKSESTTITSRLLWDWPTVKDMALSYIRYCFHGPDPKKTYRCRQMKGLFIF